MSFKALQSLTGLWRPRLMIGLGAALVVAATSVSASQAETSISVPSGVIPPPMSFPKAQFFMAHPDVWAQVSARLPRLGSDASAGQAAFVSNSGGSWETVTKAPSGGLCNPLLLTDATVIVHNCDTPVWYRLTPDIKGNYADGTWSQIASLPVIGKTQYQPQYNASAVLPDGRVIIEGGEYDGGSSGVWTNLGAIYDPVANQWTAVSPPSGGSWSRIGDAQSVVLANGTFMLAACCASPAADALLNPTNLTWTPTGAPNAGANYQDEQGYELLPNGNVLTIDVWTNYANKGNATNAEQYSTQTGTWSGAGNTPVSLPDPYQCGNFEIGPAPLRDDGTLVAFGGNTGCVAGATADPTAIYDYKTSAWSSGPDVPATCGAGSTTSCTLADAPAAVLPTGSILFAASSGYGQAPTHFFEFSTSNAIRQVADTKEHASTSGSYYYNFLLLPNGQVFSTDFSANAEVYTPVGNPVARWAPIVGKAPANVTPGRSYMIKGSQLGGRSQGAYYGDDAQASTNYPIVKLVNSATGDVSYARSYDFSMMSVAPNAHDYSTEFTVPASVETGPSSLYVIANGIASAPVSVMVN
ncbi:MAG: hypothetical protein M3Y22_18105 [Pseudomonadota bacterium]|nr:hypothetical protein [Pseudomonadota bacterium]